MTERPDWRNNAECRGEDPALFYAEDVQRQRFAKEICAHCPVIQECLRHALETDQPDGIWGGKDVDERRQAISHEATD